MSGFIYPPPTFISSCYNPAFYLSLDQTGYLTYAYAQTLYLGINDYRLSYITGITPGTATPGIALVVASDGSLSGLGALSCSSLTVNGSSVSAPPSYVLGITPGTAAASKALVLDSSSNISSINSLSATSLTGTLQTASQPNITSVANLNITAHDGVSNGLSLGGTLITASASELNYVDVVAGTASASKALILDASKNISSINSLSATSLTGTLQTASQPNITSLGTLTGISCSGNISGTLTTASQPNITSLGTLIGVSCSGNIFGTLTTASQPNITSVGTLTSLTCPSIGYSGAMVINPTTCNLNPTTLQLRGTTISTSATEWNYLHGCTPGTAFGGAVIACDSSLNLTGLNNLTCTGTISSSNTARTVGSSTGSFTASGGVYIGKNIILGGSGFNSLSWLTSGVGFNQQSTTYTDTSGSGTVASGVISSFSQPTIAASATRTITTAATLYIQNAPAAGTNTTITNPYALWVDNGSTLLNGNITSNTANSVFQGTLQVVGDVGISNFLNATSVYSSNAFLMNTLQTAQSAYYNSRSNGLQWLDGTYSIHASYKGANITPVELILEVSDNTNTTSANAAWIGTFTNNDLRLGTNDSTRMIILGGTNAGRIGIGTTSPTAQLHVSGSVSQSIDIPGNGYTDFVKGSSVLTNSIGPTTVAISITSSNSILVSSGGFYTTSDQRVKNSIEPLPDIDAIATGMLNIRPCTFKYKDQTDDQFPEVGYIAQEFIKQGIGYAVQFQKNADLEIEDPETDLAGVQYSIDYSKVVCLLHCLVLNQEKRIKDIEAKINESARL